MKAIFLSLICAIALARVVSQQELKRALAKYEAIKSLKVDFKQKKFIQEMKMPLVSEGSLNLEFPGKVTYSVVKPTRMLVTISSDRIKIETGEGKDKTVQNLDLKSAAGGENGSLQAMVAWLKLDSEQLGRDYDITEIGSNEFEFVPKATSKVPFAKLALTLNKDGHATRVVMHEKSGDRIEFEFAKPQVKY